MHRYSLGIGIALGVALLMGAQRIASYDLLKVGELEAKKIRVVDDNSVTRIALGVNEDLSIISLFDSQGHPTVMITCNDDASSISLVKGDENKATLIHDGSTALRMYDNKSNGRIVTGVINGEQPVIIIADDKGQPVHLLK